MEFGIKDKMKNGGKTIVLPPLLLLTIEIKLFEKNN